MTFYRYWSILFIISLLLMVSSVWAGELSRLFTTPKQREQLEQERKRPPIIMTNSTSLVTQAKEKSYLAKILYKGSVFRKSISPTTYLTAFYSDGKTFSQDIEGKEFILEGIHATVQKLGLDIRVLKSSEKIFLLPGQSLHLFDKSITKIEGYDSDPTKILEKP